MTKTFIAALLLSGLALSAAAAAAAADRDGDWNLRIKQEGKGLTIHWGGTHHYGDHNSKLKGSGVLVDKVRAVAVFSRVRVDGPIDVRMSQAAADELRVQADDNIEPLIETRVEGDTLVVGLKPHSGFDCRNEPRVNIAFKALQSLQMKGSGDVRLDRLKADSFNLNITGSGDLHMGLVELRELNASLSGSGDLEVAGRADAQNWSLSGSGDVSARALSGKTVKAHLSGSGDMDLGVSEQLDAKLSGSGDLSYAGRPKVSKSVTGSGELNGY
ncbi:head GIN domain-containing protein [Paucibacter sp. APW11]|uniref:Head GIN domain-containing protein n=1 Tax=Roseateles aquae TaxID=3077235 RepID=A0ABU3PC39_9BURK|nr:head GIN domain-containing protein [Paucibacter sp. APW11]MDT9000134.1 head GIN domain-containing protein [Paucibacter sp. APW11]